MSTISRDLKVTMTKNEILDNNFHDFLIWCSQTPEGKDSDLVFWLDHNHPSEDNFWEWMVKYNYEALKK